MYIKNLKLKDFRNYESLDLNFNDSINIFYGDNAQGKTNILEAIFLCASGRSHRTSKDQDLIKYGSDNFYIRTEIEKNNTDTRVEIFFSNEKKKRIRINDIGIKKMVDLIGNVNAVLFSPEDLMIIKEGPSERRRFVDITLSQLRPTYFYELQQYNKVLFQRNSLLKEIQKKRFLLDTLEVWDEKLIEIGSSLILSRQKFIDKLNVLIENNHGKLTADTEKLFIRYVSSFYIKNYGDTIEIKENFKKDLKTVRNKELLRGISMIGPQRDDYEINLNSMNIRTFGSQGQQRTAILSIKLSEIEIMKEETGEYPILLLDDVMSELDYKRQEFLIERLKNVQTFITCTDKEFFVKNKERLSYYLYNVSKGSVYVKDNT